MTVALDPAHFSSASGMHDRAIVVCAWRGACLELFARAERAIADTLDMICASGIAGERPKIEAIPLQRSEALAHALAVLAPKHSSAKLAVGRFDDFQTLYANRAWLAHGTFRTTAAGFTVRGFRYKSGKRDEYPPVHRTMFDMLALLSELNTAVRLLATALGQVRRVCRDYTAEQPA